MANDVEYLFMWLYANLLSSFVKYQFQSYAHFFKLSC